MKIKKLLSTIKTTKESTFIPEIICLTGKMASGKNYISKLLLDENSVSVDLDNFGHMAINSCKDQIYNAFNEIAEKVAPGSDGLVFLPYLCGSTMPKYNPDARGSFTELLKTEKCGQVSVNISKPGITKGQHWHNTKWEFFIVVSGHGLIQMRKIGSDEVLNYEVTGDKIQAIHMLPGYTHNIINLSKTENLVTVMWANENFNPNKPDTFFEVV